ncbi:MAG TPA: ankyrin repeat domain-containing protein, partial [Mucilaginibacter sp.]
MSIEKLEEYIAANDLGQIELLLEQNPKLATTNTSHQVSPLMLSCYYRKPEVTRLLLNYTKELTLFEAAAAGRLDIMANLIYNSPNSLDDYAADGFTALGLACYFGNYDEARYLVLKGADVNRPSNNGFYVYPLHSACAGNYT